MKRSIITLLKNINFLLSNNMREYCRQQTYETLLRVEDYCDYELPEHFNMGHKRMLKILNYEQTIAAIIENPKSFCRFGDGEIEIINGKSIPFQDYEVELAVILAEILAKNEIDMYVGINYNYFHSTKMLNEFNRKFYMLDAHVYRNYLLEKCNPNRTYIAAGFNQLYMCMEDYDYGTYYDKIKKMFEGRELVICSGKGILSNYKYDIFELAKNKQIIEGPNRNAFSEYRSILEKMRSFSKKTTICFILGPTSKALVYQLTKEGYTAWDIGHMAKDYDSYMKKTQKNENEIRRFFAPD